MALRLVRQTSDTPNITNKDDTIMTRYAYGGYNGVVKAFGSECGYTAENGIFKILSGRILVDGWEIDVDGAGWSFDFSNITGTQYHSVYAEINVATETVKIESTYLTGSYPEITKGDDLTTVPNGTARILLYEVVVENGTITGVSKKVEVIRHLKDRLEELGFKMGVAEFRVLDSSHENLFPFDETKITVNSLKKQGKYCIFNFKCIQPSTLINRKIYIPESFRPSEDVYFFVKVSTNITGIQSPTIRTGYVTTDGFFYFDKDYAWGYSDTTEIEVLNAGWKIK